MAVLMSPTTERLRAIASSLGYDEAEAVRAARGLDSRRLPEPSAQSCNRVIRGMVLQKMFESDPERFASVRSSSWAR